MTEQAASERIAKPSRGDILELSTTSVAFEGNAVARREDGYVIFIEGALSGESVRAEITRSKSQFAEAKLREVITASPDRRAPICQYFGTCGGCSLLHMSYDAQLATKTRQVADVFERIGKITDPPVLPAIGNNEREYHYRNKMEFSFSESRWLSDEEIASGDVQDRFALGLHIRGRYDRVLDNEVCFIAHPVIPKLLELTREFAATHSLRVYDPDTVPDGLLRFLVVRNSYHTNEMMVNIVTSRYDKEMMEQYAELLKRELQEVSTLVNNINSKRAQVATGEKEIIIFGDGFITDHIGKPKYQISANSFFQTNTPQAETLYKIAEEYADLRPDDILWDLYCGAGTISLFVAPNVKHVLGIEVVEAAITDANANAKRNNISNVDFISGDLRKVLTNPDIVSKHHKPSVMIIDPPRSGMHPDVVKEVLELAPERISYISCNPATQARDIALMTEQYELLSLQPVDMFPQTWHIECVAKLRRK
ncbi:MAG TPA: 23S rRNA (uracil(1939)-C(5))-methyltransferase RlmD [Candidatus Kapabacteria bacterium]|nr:23S rRNA (uracil(1939)-C(5))-methyltransferase RlmD [Candidatus Kapabacteria bacterium]